MGKLDVLAVIESRGTADARLIADTLGLTIGGAGATLLRLHRSGKLGRSWTVYGYEYELSAAGANYLDYIRGEKEE